MTESALPALSPEEAAHSERLLARIVEEIEAGGGWISFERFMELALYAPGLGYYSAGAMKLGAAGDFVTAPEISPLFSRCLANQCMEVLGRLGGGEILEFGAGSGIMAADLLTELAVRGECPERYLILEVSAELRARQQATLAAKVPALLSRVQWLEGLPDSMTGVILANEVLDALPVQRFHVRGGEVNSVGITWQLGRLDWSEVRADDALTGAVRQIETDIGYALPDGYRSEINLRVKPWVAGLAKTLTRGAALLIDYGLPRREYYRAERSMGTLLCHYRHRFHDEPLINLGLQDIGAWVDFTAVASAAIDTGLKVGGFATQAHFLIGNGIERLLADLASRELTARVQVARQAMVLTLPGEMGERFKVLALTRDYDSPLAGFSVRDMAASL